MESSERRPVPDVDDPVLAPFWEATRQHRLEVRRCRDCGRLQWPPKPRCAGCAGARFEWVEIEPRGVLYTHFTAMRSFHPAFVAETPYSVGVVELADGVRMLGRLAETEEPRVGMEMEAVFVDFAESATLVYWKRSAGD